MSHIEWAKDLAKRILHELEDTHDQVGLLTGYLLLVRNAEPIPDAPPSKRRAGNKRLKPRRKKF